MPKQTHSNQKSTQTNPDKLPTRQLTIRGGHYEYQYKKHPTPPEVPFLELRGYWLKQAVFFKVVVTTCLIIKQLLSLDSGEPLQLVRSS